MPLPLIEGAKLPVVEPVRGEEVDRLRGLGEEVAGLVAADDDGDARGEGEAVDANPDWPLTRSAPSAGTLFPSFASMS